MLRSLEGALPEPASRLRFAFAAKGFRPFFVLASAFAVAIVPLWIATLNGVIGQSTYLDPVSWHAHEMIFGFAVAVIAGFLLTAVGNWTKRETLVGRPLLLLSGVWLFGRAVMTFPDLLPRGVVALADLAFLPLLALALARPLIAAGNRRNFVMLALLGALFVANGAVHLEALGMVPVGSARRACTVALDVVLVVVLIIAGRVFPMFTRNATGITTIRSLPWLDRAAIGLMVAVTGADALAMDAKLAGSLAGVAGFVAGARAIHWGARHSLREPLLWVLHAGYAWLVLGLLLRAAAAWSAVVSVSSAAHALSVGAIGSLTLGMMARVALGHTGRPLAAPRVMSWAFAAISGAAIVRVFVPVLWPGAYVESLIVAAALWAAAFAAYLVTYAPVLARPRADGKSG